MLSRLRERFAAAYCAAAEHHLRQPLLAISLYASALEARAADPDVLRVLRGMQFSLHVLEQHFDILLDLSRLEAGVIKPRVGAVRLMPLLEQAIEAERPIAAHRGVELRVVRTSANVRCDPVLLQRMVEHLLTSAVCCTTRGCIVVGCRRSGSRRLRLQLVGFPAREPEYSIVQNLARRLGHAVAVEPAALSIDLERAS
jgi:signal transduction histidine kinase